MARIGYARVSSTDQDLSIQVARLKAEGCGIIRSEKVSGGRREGRTELATIIEFLRPDDELVVARLDRLGRDTRDVLNIVHEVEQKGGHVTVSGQRPVIVAAPPDTRLVASSRGAVEPSIVIES